MYFSEDISYRMNFDKVSTSYQNARPEYPDEMYQDIAALFHMTRDNLKLPNVLEVGSGSGQATSVLATFSDLLDCIEPGDNFVRLLEETYQQSSTVTIYPLRFEDYPRDKQYDLIFSGCALHWVPREVAIDQSIKLLNQGGWLMAVWNMPSFDDAIYDVIAEVIIPFDDQFEVPKSTRESLASFNEGYKSLLSQGGFGKGYQKIYRNTRHLDNLALVDLIWSYVNLTALGEEYQEQVFESLTNAISSLGKERHAVGNCYPFAALQKSIDRVP